MARESTPHLPVASWIITYSDVATLLLTFFILTFVILNEAKRTIYLYVDSLLVEIERELRQYADESGQADVIQISRSTKGVKITISSAEIFDSNQAEIREDFQPTLQALGNLLEGSMILNVEDILAAEIINLKEYHPKVRQLITLLKDIQRSGNELKVEIRIEGHTDNLSILRGKYKTNLELSTARALSVLTFLSQEAHIPESRFSALGYGEHRPISTNATEKDRALNRRVDIYIDAEITELEARYH